MATFTDHIGDDLAEVITQQPVFFVSTAAAEGRINCSPKGMDTFRVLDPTTVAYLDYTGSGNETAAHLAADGRITIMLCRFDRRPDIIRLYGRGRVVARGTTEWEALAHHWDVGPAARQLIVAELTSVQESCGYAVPVMELVEPRGTYPSYAARMSAEKVADTWRANATSIDGLAAPPITRTTT